MQRNHLKIHFLLFALLFMGAQAFSQENNIKFTPFKLTPLPVPSSLQFGYERVIGEQASLGLTAKMIIPQGLENTDLDFTSSTGATASGSFQSGTFTGIILTPELRFYTSKKTGAANGFYLMPFLRYFNYGIDGDFEYRPDNGDTNSDIDARINFSGFGGGFGLGVQKIWDSGFLIDWNAGLGLALTAGRINGDVVGPVTDDIPEFIDQIADAISAIPTVNARFENDGTGSTLNARARGLPWPILKTQLAIGYAF